jgi:uroporphyrinogen-III synthase
VALLEPVKTVCIGPVTAATARNLGLRVDAVAQEHTVEGLVAAVEQLVAPTGERELVESRA